MEKSVVLKKQRGRPLSFDREDVIEAVMNLFWEKGYKNVSFHEIAHETGISRASLYNAFETKEALFLEVIQHYIEKSRSPELYQIQENGLVGPVFYKMLDAAATFFAKDKKNRGCLMINSVSELFLEDTEPGQLVRGFYNEGLTLITRLVKQAIRQKELDKNTDLEATANSIMAFMNGFTIISRSGLSEKKLRATAHNFLSQIGFKYEK